MNRFDDSPENVLTSFRPSPGDRAGPLMCSYADHTSKIAWPKDSRPPCGGRERQTSILTNQRLILQLLVKVIRRIGHEKRNAVIWNVEFLGAGLFDYADGLAENCYFWFCVIHCVPPLSNYSIPDISRRNTVAGRRLRAYRHLPLPEGRGWGGLRVRMPAVKSRSQRSCPYRSTIFYFHRDHMRVDVPLKRFADSCQILGERSADHFRDAPGTTMVGWRHAILLFIASSNLRPGFHEQISPVHQWAFGATISNKLP